MNPLSPVSTPPTPGTDPRRPSSRLGAVAVVAIAALGLGLVAASILAPRVTAGDDTGTTSGAAVTTVAPEPTAAASGASADEPITPKAASSTLTTLLKGFATASKPGATTDLSAIASDAILEDFANEAQELEANGWVRTGAATVASVVIRSHNRTTGDVVVAACIDSTRVVTLDAAGEPLAASTPRALNLYTLSSEAGAWRVVARTFPDETAC